MHGRLRLPAEWERQSAVMLTWPRPDGDFGKMLSAVEQTLSELAAAVTRFQPLLISCADEAHRDHIARLLARRAVVEEMVAFVVCPANDIWVRDHGPIGVVDILGNPVLLDFSFNGWGGKYPAEQDNQLTARLHQAGVFGKVDYRRIHWVLEGGSIDSDGAGALLTTSACLLTETRNPGVTREHVSMQLRERFGVERILWLDHGELTGDDTDSHVDMLARFCSADSIAYSCKDDPNDPDHAALDAMRRQLEGFVTADGQPYRLIPLPCPAPIRNDDGHVLPGSYANFLIINGAVLVPCYDDPTDEIALQRLAEAFPDRRIIGIPARPLIHQFGSIHCATMQLPAGLTLPGLGATTNAC